MLSKRKVVKEISCKHNCKAKSNDSSRDNKPVLCGNDHNTGGSNCVFVLKSCSNQNQLLM